MARPDLLLVQMDEAYERLRRRLEGLTEDEYFWEPVPGCWTVHRDETGRWVTDYAFPDPVPAPVTTIGWRLVHIADCKVMYHEHAFGARRLTFPDLIAPATVRGRARAPARGTPVASLGPGRPRGRSARPTSSYELGRRVAGVADLLGH